VSGFPVCSSGALGGADPVHQDLEQGRLTRTVLAHDANPSKYKNNLYFLGRKQI
jgi:hypothetical protein